MGKNAIRIFAFVVIFGLLFALVVEPSFASRRHREEVLGASTSNLQMTPTAEGPGFILPDSPLFFLDQFKQSVRLTLAITSEQKTKVYNDIAGERLAELRFMLAKNNRDGVRTALQGVSDNLKKAANELDQAKLSGRDVASLAEETNQEIKAKQRTLDGLENQAIGEVKSQIKTANAALTEAKYRIEDSLPEDKLQDEILEDLEREAGDEAQEASDSALALKENLEDLQEEASEAAKKALSRRELALRNAVEQRNEALKRSEERLLELEKKKQDRLLEVRGQAAEQAKEAVEKAREAALKFKNAHEKSIEIRRQSLEKFSTSKGLSSEPAATPTAAVENSEGD